MTSFLRVSTFKNLLSISKVESTVKLPFLSYCLIKVKYYMHMYKTLFSGCHQPKTWTFANISLGLLPGKENFFSLLRNYYWNKLFYTTLTPDQHPCSSLASCNWSKRFFILPVMPTQFFFWITFKCSEWILCFKVACHSRFVKPFVLRVSLMLGQSCLERTKCLTNVFVVTVLARHFVDNTCLFFSWDDILNSTGRTPNPPFRAVDYPNIQRS